MSETTEMIKMLTADYDRCQQQLHGEDSQFWRRTYVRTVFSMIEAFNQQLRQKALNAACAEKEGYNISRILLLQDVTNRVRKNGSIEEEELRVPFVNYTAFILRSLAEESETDAAFFSDNGWNEFQKAVDVRNRLTHPKKKEDLTVTDEDLALVHEALRWYANAMCHAMGNKDFWQGHDEF
ncbi:MAG: hypothetical protein NT105_22565 [Verrucomicrobia bacterium]|nr:hypothetical protein [Verrucomicrobiota bacterium]